MAAGRFVQFNYAAVPPPACRWRHNSGTGMNRVVLFLTSNHGNKVVFLWVAACPELYILIKSPTVKLRIAPSFTLISLCSILFKLTFINALPCVSLSGQSLLWEQQKQLHQLHQQMKTLAVPVLCGGGGGGGVGVGGGLGVHRPLSRTQSSPASTSLTLPEKPLSLTAQDASSKPRFTTGEFSPFSPLHFNRSASTFS